MVTNPDFRKVRVFKQKTFRFVCVVIILRRIKCALDYFYNVNCQDFYSKKFPSIVNEKTLGLYISH